MNEPVRIQRKRSKGYNMQEHSQSINGLPSIYVGRPTIWGNPYNRVRGNLLPEPFAEAAIKLRMAKRSNVQYSVYVKDAEHATVLYKKYLDRWFYLGRRTYQRDLVMGALKGHNLACWCPLDQPCHADVLLQALKMGMTNG